MYSNQENYIYYIILYYIILYYIILYYIILYYIILYYIILYYIILYYIILYYIKIRNTFQMGKKKKQPMFLLKSNTKQTKFN